MTPARRPRRPSRRRSERGVAMFVVMMLVMMVSAAGVFVAKSSSLEIRSSGYVRQAAQTHYISESGASAVVARMRTNCGAYFNTFLRTRAMAIAPECPRITTSRGDITPPCYAFLLNEFNVITSPQQLFRPATGSGSSRLDGSFGAGGLTPNFRVMVTELGADTAPRRGTDLSSPALTSMPMRYLVESTGSSELETATYGADATNDARGTEQLRAVTVIQCN